MYTNCFRCKRSLGTNSELPHLRVGRRIAFDADKGRVWVVCTRCQQWNLTPLEERWEVLREAEHVAATAESRAEGNRAGLARTAHGLELLNVRGLANVDIANWRYGRRLQQRRSLLWWIAGASLALAVSLGIRAGVESGSRDVGIYAGLVAAVWFGLIWRDPPRLRVKVVPEVGAPATVWSWQLRNVRIHAARPTDPPTLIVPQHGADLHLEGPLAAAFLAAFLAKVNGSDCSSASIERAVGRVTDAEKGPGQETQRPPRSKRRRRKAVPERNPTPQRPLRPWERLAVRYLGQPILAQIPEHRLALEMAVSEELEQLDLTRRARIAVGEWPEQEGIAAIADDLIVPQSVRDRLADARKPRS